MGMTPLFKDTSWKSYATRPFTSHWPELRIEAWEM